jgi:hypothetical protein
MKSAFKAYYIFFLCTNIFLPKIDLGFGNFYVFEIVNFPIFILFVVGNPKVSLPVQTYLLFLSTCFVGLLSGLVSYLVFDFVSFVRLVKFTFFTFYMIVPLFLFDRVNESDLRRVVGYQVAFIFFAGLYVVYNMVTNPLSVSDYIWGYDNRYRLVGLTGYSIGLNGLQRLESTTSVSMGVFVAYLFLICLSVQIGQPSKKGFVTLLCLFVFELLTFSRAGLVVISAGVGTLFLARQKPQFYFKVGSLAILVLIAGYYFDLVEVISKFGTLSKIFSVSQGQDGSINTRLDMLYKGLDFMTSHPGAFFFGNGYGDNYTMAAIGYKHLEGLVPTIVFSCGIFALAALILHTFTIWIYSRPTKNDRSYANCILHGTHLFIPGWFLSFMLSGNTFQTDFYFPVIYFLLITSRLLCKNKKSIDS